MSFVKTLKRAFGFQSEDSVDDGVVMDADAHQIHYRDASVVPLKSQHLHQSDEPVADSTVSTQDESAPKEEVEQDARLLEIFDGVLTIFNEAQPQFIRDCLDRDAQRRYLYKALQTSVESYVGSLANDARAKALDFNREERERLHADVEALREREKQAEQIIAEQQTKQLSAQRQKRALAQRIEDYEKKISALEAEKEQSDLQIRSLVNKLKVAEVKDGDISSQRDEIESLKNDVSAKNAENTRLGMMLEQQNAELTELRKALDEARAQVAEAQVTQMTDEDRRLIQDVQAEMAKFEDIKKTKDAKIAVLKKQVAELTGQISAQTSQLEAASVRNAELEAQLSALQDMLQDMQRNSALEQTLQARQNMLDEKSTAESTVADSLPSTEAETQPAKRTRSRRKPKVSAIDENLESVNWLLTVPSDENPAPSVMTSTTDADFGYQPPVKKEIASNDAQLTLF